MAQMFVVVLFFGGGGGYFLLKFIGENGPKMGPEWGF